MTDAAREHRQHGTHTATVLWGVHGAHSWACCTCGWTSRLVTLPDTAHERWTAHTTTTEEAA